MNTEVTTHEIVEVSFVIVSWNVAKLLSDCIRSIVENVTEISFEIIVVDNNSTDHTIPMLRKMYPWVKLLANSENVGFARANNQAFEIAKGRYIFILNPDTLIKMETLPRLVNIFSNYPKVGMVGPKLIFPNGEVQKQCARLLPTLSSKIVHDIFRAYKLPIVGNWFSKRLYSPYSFNISKNVEAISGAAMLIRHQIITQLKGFGQQYLHTGEDIDLCFRVRKAGWDIYYNSEAIVIHYAGQSSSKSLSRVLVNALISQQAYFSSCYNVFQGLLYRIIVQSIEIPVTIIMGIVKLLFSKETIQQFKIRLAIVRGIWMWREITTEEIINR